jgi:hypothetical protein
VVLSYIRNPDSFHISVAPVTLNAIASYVHTPSSAVSGRCLSVQILHRETFKTPHEHGAALTPHSGAVTWDPRDSRDGMHTSTAGCDAGDRYGQTYTYRLTSADPARALLHVDRTRRLQPYGPRHTLPLLVLQLR